MSNVERRLVNGEVELRSTGNGKTSVVGYAAVFGAVSKPMGRFVETVKTGAFRQSLKQDDVRSYFNHDKNLILGRLSAGTLKVAEDSHGLHYEVTPGNRSYERDLMESIERGDINQSSFGFKPFGPKGESWSYTDKGTALRSLDQVTLFDVSPVATPAYEDSYSGLSQRSLEAVCELRGMSYADVAHMDVTEAINAILSSEQRAEVETDVAEKLRATVEELRTGMVNESLSLEDASAIATDLAAIVSPATEDRSEEAEVELEVEERADFVTIERARLELRAKEAGITFA